MINAQDIKKLKSNTNRAVTGNDITQLRQKQEAEKQQLSYVNPVLMRQSVAEIPKPNEPFYKISLPSNEGKTVPSNKNESKDYMSLLSNPDYSEKSQSAGEKPNFWYKYFKDSDFDFGQFKNDNVSTIEGIKTMPGYQHYTADTGKVVMDKGINLNADKYNAIKNMNTQDVGIYNYIFNTEGKQAADKYLDEYIQKYSTKKSENIVNGLNQFSKEHPVLGSLASAAVSVPKAEGLAYAINQKKMGETIDHNNTMFLPSSIQNGIRSTVKENNEMGKVGSFLYDAGMSTIDSLLAAPLGPTGGALLLAGGAGSDTAQQVKQNGGSDSQALLSGLTSAAAEAVFERISLGNLKSLKEVPISSVKDIAMNTIKSTFVNASEEAATELSNVISDYLINGDLSDYQSRYNNYVSQGMTPEEARGKAIKDMAKRIGTSALAGAVSGGVMASVGQTMNLATNGIQNPNEPQIDFSRDQLSQMIKEYRNTLQPEVTTSLSENIHQSTQNPISDVIQKNIIDTPPKQNESLKSAVNASANWSGMKSNIQGVNRIENGKAKVDITSNGEKAIDNLEQVQFEDEDVQRVYGLAENYKTNGSKAFVTNYDGNIDSEIYNKAFSAYYDAGVVNLPMDKVNSAYGSLLNESVRMNAYAAGVNDAKTAKLNSRPVIKDFGIVENEASMKLNGDTKQALHELGKLSKTAIVIDESIAGGVANGMYQDGVLHIALDSTNPYLVVAKHELTHAIQEYSPDAYKTYKDFVISEINKSDSKTYNDMVDRLIQRYSEIGQTITRDDAMDEIVADASEMFLTDKSSIDRLAEHDKNIAEKVLELVRGLIEKIQNAISSLEPRSKAAIALNENLETAKEAERLWINALSDKTSDISERVENLSEDSEVLKQIKYQLKDVDYTEYTNALRENQKLREINALLEEQFTLTKELKPNRKQVQKVAKEITQKTNSSYPVEKLAENLETLWQFNNEHPNELTTDEMVEAINGMSTMILKKSTQADKTLIEQYQGMLDDIKKTPLILAQKYRSELSSEGGIVQFVKKYQGKIRIVTENGVNVEDYYQELSEKYPEYFDANITNPADQLIKIADTIDFIKPVYYNAYGMSLEESARDLTNEIISSVFFDIKEAPPTFADKKRMELAKIKTRYNQKVKELHAEYQKKYNERLTKIRQDNQEKINAILEKAKTATEEQKAEYREQIKKLKDQNLQKLKAQQGRYQERVRTARERRERFQEANKYKGKIKTIAKELSDMLLKPTEKKHLPPGFRNAIKEVCQILDFETGTSGTNGEPSKAALKWRKLKDAYASLKDDDSIVSSMYIENIESSLNELSFVVEGKRINHLKYEELERVYEIMKHIKSMVTEGNKTFTQGLKDTVDATAHGIISDMSSVKPYTQKNIVANNPLLDSFIEMLTKGNIKPYYFFKNIGGDFERLYTNVRNAEDTFVKDFEEGNIFAHEVGKRYDYYSWKDDEAVEFTTVKGAKIKLTTEERLYIYAAYRRKQGKAHIEKGGVVTDEPKVISEEKNGKKVIKEIQYQSDPVQFSEIDMERLAETLTEEQKGYVHEMVDYLSKELGKKGNDVANKLFNMDTFTDENYIPLTSDQSYISTRAGVTTDARIKRMAFTKPIVNNASNPIIATDFTKVWSQHLVDMSMYHSLVLPLEDFNRVWNFKEKLKTGEEVSVKNAIRKAYGPKANEYIKKFIEDLNGGIKQDVGGKLSNLLISKMKVDAVMGNLSVAIQQPSSIARAMVIINPKYFGKALFSKKSYDELIEHSPQAVLKKYGYFDVNMGRSLSDVVSEKELETPVEKIKAFFTDKNVRNEVFSWLPQKMDEISWTYMWSAVKAEVSDKTNLKEGTEEYWDRVNARFKEVIDRSQVMDSVFQRSELMRSTNPLARIATNFMAEPTVSYNMLYDAITEAKKNGKASHKYVSRAVGSVLAGMILNSLLKSIISAGRDKDKDKEYGEKYTEAFVKNLSDDPLGMIPYVNSIYSTMQGYEPIRPDMQLFQNLYYAWSKLDSDKYTPAQKVLQISQAISPFFNVPLKNISRDIEMIWRNGYDALEKTGIVEGMTDFEKLQKKYPTVESSAASSDYYDLLYKAKKEKDAVLYKQIYDYLMANGKKPSNIDDAMNNRKREELIRRSKEENYTDPVVEEAYKGFSNKNASQYQASRKKLLDRGYSVKDIDWAVNYLKDEISKDNAPTAQEFIEAYKTDDSRKWKPIYNEMKAAGWTEKDLLALTKQ